MNKSIKNLTNQMMDVSRASGRSEKAFKELSISMTENFLCVCLRCGHGSDPNHPWVKRMTGRPSKCPHCNSAKWDIPRSEHELGRKPKPKGVKS